MGEGRRSAARPRPVRAELNSWLKGYSRASRVSERLRSLQNCAVKSTCPSLVISLLSEACCLRCCSLQTGLCRMHRKASCRTREWTSQLSASSRHTDGRRSWFTTPPCRPSSRRPRRSWLSYRRPSRREKRRPSRPCPRFQIIPRQPKQNAWRSKNPQ